MKSDIVLHWSAGFYSPNWIDMKHYHGGVIVKDGFAKYEQWHNYNEKLAHTWRRNSRSIGLTVCAMYDASPGDFGGRPVTFWQIKSLVLAAAEVAYLMKINTNKIITHAEAAIEDDYFGERWDLALLKPGKLNWERAVEIGRRFRKMIRKIKIDFLNDKRRLKYHWRCP